MAYDLYSEDGYVQGFASISGYGDLIRLVEKDRRCKALRAFFDKGETTAIQQVIGEINQLLPRVKDKSILATLQDLRRGLKTVKEIAIITDSYA